MEKNYETGSLEPFDFQHIFEKLPETQLLKCDISIHSFPTPLDSSDMQPKQWKMIGACIEKNYDLFDGFLVLHGTDTMSYTASALSFMLKNLKKPVILTGSQLPIGDLRTDAKENLLTSLDYACLYENNEAVIQEVVIYFEYKLLRANRSLKYSAEFFDAYQSPNYPLLGQSGVHLNINKEYLLKNKNQENFWYDEHLCTDLFFCRIFPGLSLEILLHLDPKIKVIILQVFGSGTIPNDLKTKEILKKLKDKNIEIIIISQCFSGSISFGKYSNSNIFSQIQAINGRDMTAEAAITKTMHLLNNPRYTENFAQLFTQNIAGELTLA